MQSHEDLKALKSTNPENEVIVFSIYLCQAVVPSSPLLAQACRGFQTSSQVQDVDSAAKFIGGGAATVGVAGQLIFLILTVLRKC